MERKIEPPPLYCDIKKKSITILLESSLTIRSLINIKGQLTSIWLIKYPGFFFYSPIKKIYVEVSNWLKKYNKIKYVLQIRSYFTGLFSAVLSRALVVNDLHLRNGMPRWYVILDSKNYGDEIVKLQPLSHVWSNKKTIYIYTDEKNI